MSAANDTELYRAIVEASRDGFWMVDLEHRLLFVNDAYCRMSGYNREELLSMRVDDLEACQDGGEIDTEIARTIDQGQNCFETEHRHKSGERVPVEISVGHYNGSDTGPLFVFIRDIYDRKLDQALGQLRERLGDCVYQGDMTQLLRAAVDTAESVTQSRIAFVHFVDPDEENLSLQTWSTRTLDEYCFARGEGLHYPVSQAGVWADCIHQRASVVHNDYAALPHKKGLPEGHAPVLRELTVPVFRDNRIVAVVGVGNKPQPYHPRDIDAVARVANMMFDYVERKRAEQRIEYMAYFDTLTGLPNRVLLADRLDHAMAQVRRSKRCLAVCFIDLDGFKPVNDQHGHETGDQLLVTLARRLHDELREGDTLARIGGDEFVVLLNDLVTPQQCYPVIERMLELFRTPMLVGDVEIGLSASIGVTLYPQDHSSAEVLLRHADLAMYRAKADGKAGFSLYDPEQDQIRRTHLETQHDLQRALGCGELILHYQPRIELRTGRVVGVEALVRWQHPQRGLLMPGAFLPSIAGTEVEVALDEWVLEQAMQQLAARKRRGRILPVSVNISPKHIQSEGFVDFIRGLLGRHADYADGELELEILETAAIGEIGNVVDTIKACHRLGVRFSLDDFGTGYSSLTYFHLLPIDILKIDQKFVRGMLDDSGDTDIVEGVIRLADALKRPVVAEGVENMELALLLQSYGCQYAQGFGIARPMPAEALDEWMAAWSDAVLCRQLQTRTPNCGTRIDLQIAILSLRHWIGMIGRHVESGGQGQLPELDRSETGFHRWSRGLGAARYSQSEVFAFIPPKYKQLHEQGTALIEQCQRDSKPVNRQALTTFQDTGEELIALLCKLGPE